jgi:hypothetical protein
MVHAAYFGRCLASLDNGVERAIAAVGARISAPAIHLIGRNSDPLRSTTGFAGATRLQDGFACSAL